MVAAAACRCVCSADLRGRCSGCFACRSDELASDRFSVVSDWAAHRGDKVRQSNAHSHRTLATLRLPTVEDRVGVRFSFSKARHPDGRCEIVALRRGAGPLEAAKAFREWRTNAAKIGEIPRPHSLEKKIAGNEKVARLLGCRTSTFGGPPSSASTTFSATNGCPSQNARPFARREFRQPPREVFRGRTCSALRELAKAERPMDYLTVDVAGAIDSALSRHDLLKLAPDTQAAGVIRRNRHALADQFAAFVNPPGIMGRWAFQHTTGFASRRGHRPGAMQW